MLRTRAIALSLAATACHNPPIYAETDSDGGGSTSSDSEATTSATGASASSESSTTTSDTTSTTSTGDGEGTGDAGTGESTETGTDACPASCPEQAPICDQDDATCRGCLAHDECADVDSARPACDEDGHCKECTDVHDEYCTGDTPVCHDERGANVCTACNVDEDCPDPAAPRCYRHECTSCETDEACTHFDQTPLCHRGRCAECRPDDVDRCNDGVCDMTTFTCTNRPPATKESCEECVATAECASNRRCVQTTFVPTGDLFGFVCLPFLPPNGCEYLDPMSDPQTLPLIEGGTDEVCASALTTCAAILEYEVEGSCSDDDDDDACGVEDLDDGYCRETSPGSSDWRCTLPCNDDDDCPGVDCMVAADPAYCDF